MGLALDRSVSRLDGAINEHVNDLMGPAKTLLCRDFYPSIYSQNSASCKSGKEKSCILRKSMKPIWFAPTSIDEIKHWSRTDLLETLGIEFTEIGDDFLRATMPVSAKVHQPLGTLHGGVSCALAETIGSVAANFCVDRLQKFCVGLEINVNHVKAITRGLVTATARAMHLGKSTQIWDIQIRDEHNQLVAISRLTIAVLTKKEPGPSSLR